MRDGLGPFGIIASFFQVTCMTPPPPGLDGTHLPPSSDDRNGSPDRSSSQDPLLSELRARVISAEFGPRVAVFMFCENLSGLYANFTGEQLDNCREVRIVREHLRDSQKSGYADLAQRFQKAWEGIKQEIAEKFLGQPQLAQKVAAFFVGHLVSEAGGCLLTRDILFDIKTVHSQFETNTIGPFRRYVDALQYRIDYLSHDQGYTLEAREQLIVAKQKEQILSARKALGDVVRAHNEVRNRFDSRVDRAVSELESDFLPKFTLEERFHERMVETLARAFQKPLEDMFGEQLRIRHDQIAKYLMKYGIVQPGEEITPLVSSEE